ncbi:hypothetical protein [Clostridium ganghwense]|uniref:Uncharacterized protein n=1 Tax=Clostridium ganghwense TaxID=312089 RepID=A0ABT4CW74_9CLOT|nr:hypothetical protein [Clostridium ganghwense]MCY6372461.1 hypothetical protein [Clostridium ganghwense]
MATTPIEVLKFNLQEKQFPYFDYKELEILLETNDNDVNKATYKGCMMKAQEDGLNIGPLKTESNKEYWLNLAKSFKPKKTYNYITSMKRSDGQ